MLQQTRVAAVIPYFERFLQRFPRVEDLAAASETEVLSLWSGLGYYSRARNLQTAAHQIVQAGAFPREYASIRALAGVGDYTAAAVASIAFGLPHAAIDGNVRRVIMRLTGDATADLGALATQLLTRHQPGRWNQALMELGALVCLPREPLCIACPAGCPVAAHCQARIKGVQSQLPPPKKKPAILRKERVLLIIRRKGRILLIPSSRVSGFWELPELSPGAFSGVRLGPRLGSFRHAITNSLYHFEVREARTGAHPRECRWWDVGKLGEITLSTAAKKALRCLKD